MTNPDFPLDITLVPEVKPGLRVPGEAACEHGRATWRELAQVHREP